VTGATYALIDAAFLVVVLVVAVIASVVALRRSRRRHGARGPRRWWSTTLVTGLVVGVVLVIATIVFDNVIVVARIVAYDPTRISGLRIGAVPIEDLAYAIAAVVLLPSLAVLFGPRRAPRAAPTVAEQRRADGEVTS
jgi:lycopene cyclase domain-containing protein